MKIEAKILEKRYITGKLIFSDKTEVIVHQIFDEITETVEDLIENECLQYLELSTFQKKEAENYFNKGFQIKPDKGGYFQDSDGEWHHKGINVYDEIWA